MHTNTKQHVSVTVTPVDQTDSSGVQPTVNGVQKTKEIVETQMHHAKEIVEHQIQNAKEMVGHQVENAKAIVKPLVQPVVDSAVALKDYGTHKVEELLHLNQHKSEDAPEDEQGNKDSKSKSAMKCDECVEVGEKKHGKCQNCKCHNKNQE